MVVTKTLGGKKKTDHFAQPLDRKLLNSTIKISINSSN